jgi:nucleotidyltransferase/DNA polymerase involved in DNA repair
MDRCIFHIELDTFLVSVEQVLNPKLKGKPVIIDGDRESAAAQLALLPMKLGLSASGRSISAVLCTLRG